MTPKLTLYRANGACSLVPHILLHELDIPFSTISMTFGPDGLQGADGTLSHGEYLKINPSGFVPALQIEDEEVLTENPAILTYIASLAPQRPVFGKDRSETAKVYRWLCWLSGTLHGNGYAMILRPARFTNDTSAYAGVVAQGRRKIEDCYERIERHLKSEYVVGDGFTVADLNL